MYHTLSRHFKIFLTPKGTQQQRLLHAKNLQSAYVYRNLVYHTLSPHFKIFLTPKGTQQLKLLYAKNLQYAYCRTVARRRRPHTHTHTYYKPSAPKGAKRGIRAGAATTTQSTKILHMHHRQ